MFLVQGNSKIKLKATNISKKLTDKSTLPILWKGLRDISLKVIERPAFLKWKFNYYFYYLLI